MNKTEFIKQISEKTKLNQKDCSLCLTAITQIIQNTLQSGDSVSLIGFGKFEVKHRLARRSYNPQTKQVSLIPASSVPTFKAGKVLKSSFA